MPPSRWHGAVAIPKWAWKDFSNDAPAPPPCFRPATRAMFGGLIARRRAAAPAAAPHPPAVPAGQRVYAIGDVHGRIDLLDTLLDAIARDDAARGPAETTRIFLGDLIDRGPSSREVIERVMTIVPSDPYAHAIMGNHEEVLLAALDGDPQAIRLFYRIGGVETMLSYGADEAMIEQWDFDDIGAFLESTVPPDQAAFLRSMEQMITIGDYCFVHAGIRPGVAFDEQRASDLRWIREPFLASDVDHGRVIVHGHSITDAVEDLPNRIGIDTGAFASGRLSALGLEGTERWFLAT